MDIQETIDSLRKVLESVIAPGVESLRLRLDAQEKDIRENGQGIDRLDARVDRLTGRMEEWKKAFHGWTLISTPWAQVSMPAWIT